MPPSEQPLPDRWRAVLHERALALIEHLGQLAHDRREQADDPHDRRGDAAHLRTGHTCRSAHRCRHLLDGSRRCRRDVPCTTERTVIGTEDRQCPTDVVDVAPAVDDVGLAQHGDTLSAHQSGQHPISEMSAVSEAGTEEVRSARLGHAYPARPVRSQRLFPHRHPHRSLPGRRIQLVGGAHR